MSAPTDAKVSAQVSPLRRALVNLGGLGLWGSGVAWLVLHYFMVRQGEFGPERSPYEAWSLKVHGAFAFLALWTLGLLWGVHILHGRGLHRRRWTGSALLVALLVLIVSGYLLYYIGDDRPREIASLAHWAIGLALPLAYIAHRLAKLPRQPRAAKAVA